MDNATRYNGDMTRTVVNGEPSTELLKMHETVRAAKRTGCEALHPGTTGEAVHRAVAAVIEDNGYSMVRGDARHDLTIPSMRHGTGHGIGLDVHEPICWMKAAVKSCRAKSLRSSPVCIRRRPAACEWKTWSWLQNRDTKSSRRFTRDWIGLKTT